MSGYREYIEIDPEAEQVDIVDDVERTVDQSGRISVGRDKEGTTYSTIILVEDGEPIEEE